MSYSGDGNYQPSAGNGNYTVYTLAFVVPPSETGVGLTVSPAVQVAIQDATHATQPSFAGSISLTIGANPGSGTLSGTTTQNTALGIATFSDLSINKMANGYTLKASATGGQPVVESAAFNVDGLLFVGTDQDTFNSTGTNQLARLLVNGSTIRSSTVFNPTVQFNGIAQGPGAFLFIGDPDSNTLSKIDFTGSNATTVNSNAGFPNACCNEDMMFDGTNIFHAHYEVGAGQIDVLKPDGSLVTSYQGNDVTEPVGITKVGNDIWISRWSLKDFGIWSPGSFTKLGTTTANAGGLTYDPVNQILWVGQLGGCVKPYTVSNGAATTTVDDANCLKPLGAIGDTIDGLEFVSSVP